MIRIGIIGFGYWGPHLFKYFSDIEDVIITSVADKDKTKLGRLHKFGKFGMNFYSDPFDVIADKNTDAIVIATPSNYHYELAKAAIKEGKNVFVEKPMTTNSAEAEELVELSYSKGITFMVDHIICYDSAVEYMRNIIERAQLGRLYYSDSVRINLGMFRSDANVIWDLASHDISILDFLIPFDPVSVSVKGLSFIQNVDVAYITLHYLENFTAHIHVSWLSPVKIRRFQISGSQRMITFNELDKDEKLKIYDKKIELERDPKEIQKIMVGYKMGNTIVPPLQNNDTLGKVCRHFIECINTNKQPITNAESGLRVVRILEACQKSLNSNGSEIDIYKNRFTYTKPVTKDEKIQKERYLLLRGEKFHLDTSEPTDIHIPQYNILIKQSKLGQGVSIWSNTNIYNADIGDNTKIGAFTEIGQKVKIGKNVKIEAFVFIPEGVEIEDNVFIGPGVRFTNDKYPKINGNFEIKKTIVRKGASIGAGSVIVCGVEIGEDSMIGAGSVVTNNVPKESVVYGEKAKVRALISDAKYRSQK